MNGLMYSCLNWGDVDCHPDVSIFKYPKKLKNGENIPVWPIGAEQKKLDYFCKSCELRFFEIEKKECPICGCFEFVEKSGIEITIEGDKEFENFYIKCIQCKTPSIQIKRD
jgi:hypothetical protein